MWKGGVFTAIADAPRRRSESQSRHDAAKKLRRVRKAFLMLWPKDVLWDGVMERLFSCSWTGRVAGVGGIVASEEVCQCSSSNEIWYGIEVYLQVQALANCCCSNLHA